MSEIVDCSAGVARDATPEEEAAIAADQAAAASTVPESVSRRQLRLALLDAGHLDNAQAYIDTATRRIKISWADGSHFERNSPLIKQLKTTLGLTAEQMNAIFRAAAAQ